jgi:tRNA (guanine-N7-)-methyltransferase
MSTTDKGVNPNDFIISKKRKKYKFAWFANLTNCFEADEYAAVSSPTIVEIGAGDGRFALELARRYPQHQIVAIDVKADRLQTSARQAIDEKLTNIVFVRTHAERLVELLQGATVEQLWLTFSDPFPKKRQAKHRLTHPRFLGFYAQILADNGILRQKTDNQALFEWSLEQLVTQKWQLEAITFDLHASGFDNLWKHKTTYETAFLAEGAAIKALQARQPESRISPPGSQGLR